MNRLPRVSSLFLLAALTACGTGLPETDGFDDDANDDADVELEDGEDDADVGQALVPELLDAEERAFVTLINQYRAGRGKAALRVSVALTRASDFHSADMAAHDKLQHASFDGTDTFTRIRRYYNYNTYMAENVAMGYTTAAAVFEGWRNSPGHDANMLGDTYTVIGIARQAAADGSMYWTTDFGGYKDAILSAGVSSIASNGGFESDAFTVGTAHNSVKKLGRWHTFRSSGGTAVRSTTSPYTGSWMFRTADPSTGTAEVTQAVRAAPRVNYGVSARYRRRSGTGAQAVYLEFLNASWTRLALKSVAVGSATSWTAVSGTWDSPAGTAYVRVFAHGSTGAGQASTVDWDDVRITAR